MKKLEAVIFDMDGVLFDTERMSCECCFEAAKAAGTHAGGGSSLWRLRTK